MALSLHFDSVTNIKSSIHLFPSVCPDLVFPFSFMAFVINPNLISAAQLDKSRISVYDLTQSDTKTSSSVNIQQSYLPDRSRDPTAY